MKKKYVLEIVYDSEDESVDSIYEYIDEAKVVFKVDDVSLEVPDDVIEWLDSDILGLS
tara:strand:+ start:329 stop:502 length:174 start_codon:yes stop_codon:yes gene_type:complete